MSRTRSERPAVSLHAANQRGDAPSRPCVVATRGPSSQRRLRNGRNPCSITSLAGSSEDGHDTWT